MGNICVCDKSENHRENTINNEFANNIICKCKTFQGKFSRPVSRGQLGIFCCRHAGNNNKNNKYGMFLKKKQEFGNL